ncbi:unc-79 -like [Asbolus verrucosus]|uniref:Unc-79-like n=1 Tax=Asbolus verrucosus TaxID=1661398 RepID=A0A482V2H4_ASBVE|nr:unc-79 -like [Asbolus verrucosus]
MLKIPARFKQCDLSVSLAFDYCDCIVNMGTRAAAFTAKIRSLYDYQLRLMQGVMPPPSGVDIANTIKYFSQTLLTVLKDVPNSPFDLLKNSDMDSVRMGLFPSLDYKGLYNSLIPLIEVAPLIQYGLHCKTIFPSIIPVIIIIIFSFWTSYSSMPRIIINSSVTQQSTSRHRQFFMFLHFTIYDKYDFDRPSKTKFTKKITARHNDREQEICQSVSAVIMMVFQYSTNPAHHCQLLECLMTLKQNILKDILSVIAYGTSTARSSAAKLLFYYWPTFNANLFDRKNLICKFAGDPTPFVCQRDMCPNAGNAEAAKVCYDHCISITFASDTPPPLYLCIECANEIHREHPNQMFFDILHPMQQVSMVCENKNCRSTDKSAISICFSTECASYNGNHPIRYCEQCHNNRHNNRRGGDHIVHKSLPPTWSMDAEMQTYMVEAIVSLLKEAKIPTVETKENVEGKTPIPAIDNITVEERQLLGRYGVWLLVGRCTPTDNTPTEVDTLASRTSHLKDGLNRLFCLVPYEVITQEIWDYVMPHWMEAIVNDVPEKELSELRIILSKILDTEMSPLGFDAKKMYQFVAGRFQKTSAKVQEQALHWLQTLTMLEIIIPLHLLFTIFGDGVTYMKGGAEETAEKAIKYHELETNEGPKRSSISPVIEDCDSVKTSFSDDENRYSQQTEFESNAEHNLFCCILMLDILLKQMELQDIDKHTGLNSSLCKDVCWLLKCMITAAWIGNHTCSSKSECSYCESSIMWHQLSLQLIKYLSPVYPAHPPDPPLEENWDDHSRKSPPESDKKESKSDVVLNMPIPEVHSVGGVLVHMPHVCSIMTATVETVSEQLDLAAIIPAEKVVSAVARAITLSETDVAAATVQVAKPQVIGENDEPIEPEPGDDLDNFWQTSVGKFKFCVDDLPQPLQYIHQLLQELSKVDKPDILYYMLQCLNILILHGDACTKASKEHRGFFIWCQENLLIKNLWELCNSEHSHICQEVVPLLLHCITLPAGSDVFWRVIQEAFHNNDWCVRFTAVERVTVMARFMDSSPLRNILPLQAALANAFCYLISSMDDTNIYVAQRATLYLGTIHDFAIKSLIMCLETQFDSVIVDRPMVLQSLYQLHNSLSERKILTWEFFLNRFDTLFLEAQINLEKTGDISCLRDLRNTDLNSETFLRKLHRAHEALSQSDGSGASSVKTLSASFGTKWPYKRTMSAPASIIPRHENKGYSQNDRGLYLPPQRLRSSPAFSVFLSNLPQLLDQNNLMGRLLLPTCLILLQYAPSPYYIANTLDFQQPTYSLWTLEPHFRRNWLMALVVLLYKYQYSQQPHCMQLTSLIRIVLNTLDSQHHHCRRIPATIIMGAPPSRSRDVSQPSLGTENEHAERATPPLSPMFSSDGQSVQVSISSKGGKTQVVYAKPSSTTSMETHWEEAIQCIQPEKMWDKNIKKLTDFSIDADDTESELIAIPESDMSDSTLHGSIQDSFDEGMEESCCHIQSKQVCTIIKTQEPLDTAVIKSPKEGYISQLVRTSSNKRPTWIIGSEDESVKTYDNRKMQEAPKSPCDYTKNCTKINSTTSLNLINGSQFTKTVTTDFHKQVTLTSMDTQHVSKPTPLGKHKKVIEPSITPVCTPVSDCDDCFKNNQSMLPAPSLERLLPIGAIRPTGKHRNKTYNSYCCHRFLESSRDSVFSLTLESQLEIPNQERLLPIGQHTKDISQLVDKVRQALGINAQLSKFENKKPEKIYNTKEESVQSHSPRRLIKQVALESPPNQGDIDDNGHFFKTIKVDNQREAIINQRQRMRKVGPFTMSSYSMHDPRRPGAWFSPQLSPKLEGCDMKQSSFRIGDECVNERCSECGTVKEEYSDEEIGLCIVTLGTFIHREPALAAPLLPDILSIVAKVATNAMYPWQSESNIHLPGGAISVAHQFLRCVLHQLAPNGIFTQMFQTNASDFKFQKDLTNRNVTNNSSEHSMLLKLFAFGSCFGPKYSSLEYSLTTIGKSIQTDAKGVS